MKELCILKLLNHILQPTMYDDIREVAREYVLEDNVDKYLVSLEIIPNSWQFEKELRIDTKTSALFAFQTFLAQSVLLLLRMTQIIT